MLSISIISSTPLQNWIWVIYPTAKFVAVPIIWVFPKIGVPQNGWFMMENPIRMDDLRVPLFSETSISLSFHTATLPKSSCCIPYLAWKFPSVSSDSSDLWNNSKMLEQHDHVKSGVSTEKKNVG